jgi:hypothetical protein
MLCSAVRCFVMLRDTVLSQCDAVSILVRCCQNTRVVLIHVCVQLFGSSFALVLLSFGLWLSALAPILGLVLTWQFVDAGSSSSRRHRYAFLNVSQNRKLNNNPLPFPTNSVAHPCASCNFGCVLSMAFKKLIIGITLLHSELTLFLLHNSMLTLFLLHNNHPKSIFYHRTQILHLCVASLLILANTTDCAQQSGHVALHAAAESSEYGAFLCQPQVCPPIPLFNPFPFSFLLLAVLPKV